MNVLVLNGSPRPNGNTSKLISAFKEGAMESGHNVKVIDVCRMNIKGCLACEYCHTRGNGNCVQKDDFIQIHKELVNTDVLVLASPIYYHGVSGQLKCVIDRFYAPLYPKRPMKLKKVAMMLCSGDPNLYEGALFSYQGDFLNYLRLENGGVVTVAGYVSENKLEEARNLGRNL